MHSAVKNILNHGIRQIQNFINGLSFQAKLIVSIIFSISIFITLCAFLIIQNIQSNIDRQVLMLNYNMKTTQMFAQLTSQALVLNYKSRESMKNKLLDTIKEFTKQHPEIYYIVVTDNAGNILCKSKFADLYVTSKDNLDKINPPKIVPFIKVTYSKNGKLLTISEPIQFNSNFLGWVWIGIPDTGFTIVGSKKELFIFLLEIFLLVWVLSVIGAIVNSLIITRPLRKLEKSTKAITEGRFGFQLPLKGFLGKELSQLVKAFNKMSKRLQQYEESNIATLSSERNKFESVIMSIADGVIVLDKEGTVQIINTIAKKLLNKSGDELIGKRYNNLWDESINSQVVSSLNSLNTNPTGYLSEYANFEIQKDKKTLKLIITPLHDSNNDKLGTVIVMQDRTKEAEIEQIKQEFISNVSHELRTPITSIKCYVDTLCSHSEKIDQTTREEFLFIVNEETDRLSRLVNDILELSRLESPATKIPMTLQEIYPAIEYTLKAVAVLAEKKSIKLIKDIESNLPLLNINQENIERVLINLLSNAIKYTPENGTVKLSVTKEIENISFKVIDNGMGISESDLSLIFERFYRVENKVHTIKGTGLGLTIVKKSVEQHEGKISARSNLGEGSIFEFVLPIPNNESSSPVNIETLEKEPEITKTI